MSIFRDTFKPEIIASLEARQTAMTSRTVDAIQYLNSRNSFIRMTSSVNVDGKSTSANNNILQGGTLGFLGLKSGIGTLNYNAYSTKTTSGQDNRLGIRPMAGITSIDVKSKSAYGSLREVVVNFQCWDIRQLEELELLYMRPGYTVLVEWGWMPYLDNKGKIVTTPPAPYDILNKSATALSDIAKDLYNKSLKSGGNYDATFGYIKNYQWSARPDGGYDCQTTVISTGEIIESLKVNYILPNLVDYKLYDSTSKGNGYLNDEFSDQGATPSMNFTQAYEKNTLAGIWSELFYKLLSPVSKFKTGGIFDTIATSRGIDRNKLYYSFKDLKFNNITSNTDGGIANNVGTWNSYITLDVALEFINKYITAAQSPSNEALVKFYLTTSNITNKGDELLCLAHPLQVSVDPSVCLIKSPLWYESSDDKSITSNISQTVSASAIPELKQKAKAIVKELNDASGGGTQEGPFVKAVQKIVDSNLFALVEEEMKVIKPQNTTNLQGLINEEFGTGDLLYVNQIKDHLTSIGLKVEVEIFDFQRDGKDSGVKGFLKNGIKITSIQSNVSQITTIASNLPNALNAIEPLKLIPLNYFYEDKSDSELGIIRNIYVNLDFLYRTAIDTNIESQDHKEKNEISLYKYVKSIIFAINSAIGSMNNFEIHVDPIDNNVARIIDINFTSPVKPSNLFELQVHNLNSVVRNYSLQSQIFPEQSTMIAIGSQVKGGQLGIQNNTMIDFNKGLIDRIIPSKDFPNQKSIQQSTPDNKMAASLASIIQLFASFIKEGPTSTDATSTNLDSLYSQAKNSLRDIIVHFQSTINSSSANRSIIPIKFSFEMDGIGSLVIGHLFKINDDILPKGYKKANLGQTITGISHTVNNSDWTTKIDALNIILDDPTTKTKFSTINIQEVVNNALASLITFASNNLNSGNYNPVINQQLAPTTKFYTPRNLNTVNQIILHDTAGYGGINATIKTLNDNGLGIHYIVDREGKSFSQIPIEKVVYHAGSANNLSVGIEICNTGPFTPSGGKLWHPYVINPKTKKPGNSFTIDSAGQDKLKRLISQDGQTVTGGFKDFGWSLNYSRYYEDYTVAQANELKRVIIEILNKCPNIKLNYEANDLSILQNVFGLKTLTTLPTKNQNLQTTRDYSTSNSGIFSHAVISNQRGDAHPAPQMLEILKEIKNETKR